MKVHTLAVSIVLLSVFLAGSESARAHSWQECHSIDDADEHVRIEELFRYAQIAERPKHQDNRYMRDCPLPDGQTVAAPRNLLPLPLTAYGVKQIRAQLQELSGQVEYARAYLEVDANNAALLSIGCRGRNDRTMLPIYVQIQAYIYLAADYLNLGITFSPEVVHSDGDGNFTRVVWAPYFDEERQEVVSGLRGTNILDLGQILANYVGDECAFPAIELAVTHVCKSFYEMVWRPTSPDAIGFFAVSEADLTRIRSAERYRTVLTGHSLGGQAAQYIAANPPYLCSVNREISDDALRAYAFASTRNPSESSIRDAPGLRELELLDSYLIDGDEVLEELDLGQGQTGRVTTYYPDENPGLGNRHGISDIQTSICRCLGGSGAISTQQRFLR